MHFCRTRGKNIKMTAGLTLKISMAQVILKENIRKLGRIGDVVKVKDGYAFNFLVPQKKALPATKQNLEDLENQKAQMIVEDQKKRDAAQILAGKMPRELCLVREVNENGLLYGSISAKDILDEIDAITDKHNIRIGHGINKYGVYNIEIELHHDVVVGLCLSISDTVENAQKQMSSPNENKKAKKTKKGEDNSDTRDEAATDVPQNA